MGVTSSVRKTEIGGIPTDWETKSLSQIATVVRGASPRPAGDPRYFGGNYIPWLTVAAITNISDAELYVSTTFDYLTQIGAAYSRRLKRGTLIISNSGATLGVAKILDITCCANDGIAALIDQREGDPTFIAYYINSLTKRLRAVIATGNGQPNLNTRLIGNLLIPFPQLEEQRAIAEVLSDIDAQIAALDALISKKRDIKQGVMQELLTGRRRLPGFSGEWEKKRLGEIGQFYSGGTPSTSNAGYYQGNIPWITSSDLNQRYVTHVMGRISHYGLHASSAKMVAPNTVLIALYGATAGVMALSGIEAAINQAVLAVLPYTDRSDYIFFKLESLRGWIVSSFTQGGQPNLTSSIIKDIEIDMPPLEEQAAIAAALSDIDTEIAALEAQRGKTTDLKQAMMQELLTGRTRLI